ncbi:hypothetical protein RJ640_006566 [Escallonia rubra]|uniref:Homeobox-leucine zipper protein n=1 Tax=Escallonia rubra TaxID=112253 RepID=A0AA88S3G5_9ASTE|nr:hypothetical protein RJ640_006566 [Escallonia rubra]
MKRFSCSDSSGSFFYPSEEKNPKGNLVYSREFQAMLDNLDDEDSIEETGQPDKKRRLSNDQVKALEKIFEHESKLDPERKVKLAQELGLQPRQVAIWFQNRRARWKTKQLERDYNHLKGNYEALQLNFSKLEQERETLSAELEKLKGKLGEESAERNQFDGEKTLFLGSQKGVSGQCNGSPVGFCSETDPTKPKNEVLNTQNLVETQGLSDFKDGLSDSDSNAVLNEDSNLLFMSPALSSPNFALPSFCSSSSALNYSQLLDSRAVLAKAYQQQMVKMEEQSLFSSEESCNIYSVDQAPNLCWYFPDQRN